MRVAGVFVMMIAITICAVASSGAGDIITRSVESEVLAGCTEELATYCADVIPGEGRIATCLGIYKYKLSVQCKASLAQAGKRMTASLAALRKAFIACREDIPDKCPTLSPGRKNALACLDRLQGNLTVACRTGIAGFHATLK